MSHITAFTHPMPWGSLQQVWPSGQLYSLSGHGCVPGCVSGFVRLGDDDDDAGDSNSNTSGSNSVGGGLHIFVSRSRVWFCSRLFFF